MLGRGRGLDDELAAHVEHVGRAGGVVGQRALLAQLVQQGRAHAFTEHRSGQRAGRIVARAQRRQRAAQQQVRLARPGMRARAHAAGVHSGRHDVGRAGRQARERRFGAAQEGVDVEGAGRADHDIGAAVLASDVAREVVALQPLDMARRAHHRLRGRVQAEAGAVEQLVAGGDRVVRVLGQLLQQHLALALELGRGKGWVQHQVGQQAHELARMLGQPAQVERGVVLVGVRVDLGAEALGVEVDAPRIARGRALEQHVLDHMADAVEHPLLVRAAGADEDGDAGGGLVRQRQRDNAHAVGQRGDGRVGGGMGHRWPGEGLRSG